LKKLLFKVTMAGALLLPAYGEDPVSPPEKEGRIQRRKENQQDRIAQGVASGELTAGETESLEHKEAKIKPGDPE
jgi:hypothetical protein